MIAPAPLSRFLPHRTDPATLEALFVERHALADQWFAKLRESILTDAKHHLLAVGPEGCGKSHLIALLISRLRKDTALTQRVRIAWLPEDETTPSFWRLLLRILRALAAEYPAEFTGPPREELAATTENRRAELLSQHLLQHLAGRTLLVVVENLAEVLHELKDEGQKRWRAFLQEHRVTATLATSRLLTQDLSDRGRPFFHFFQIEHLRPLAVDDALKLLKKIADHSGNADLRAFLKTPVAKARVRAIRHLIGGSHRVFITLSEIATRESLYDLTRVLEELLDGLTPHYQERLRSLPDQQREIVAFLGRRSRTVQVKEIAQELFLTEQTAAAQLKSLKDKGYVTSATRGRESRYELAEPAMRLCMRVIDPQTESIRPIVAFLRTWYESSLEQTRPVGLLAGADVKDSDRSKEGPARSKRTSGLDPKTSDGWTTRGNVLCQDGIFDEAMAAYRRAIEHDSQNSSAHHGLALAAIFSGNWDQAESALAKRFQLPVKESHSNSTWPLAELLRAILLATSEPRTWTHRIARIVMITANAEKMPVLACALVRSLALGGYEELRPETLDGWKDAWQKVTQLHPDLTLTTRLLSVGLQYVQTQDERVLLDLVQEERSILVELFGLTSDKVNE